MGGGPGLLAESKEHVNRTGLVSSGARTTCHLARFLNRATEPVSGIVHRYPRRAQDDVRVETAFQEELSSIVFASRECGQEMRGGRLLAPLARDLLGDPPELDQVGIAVDRRESSGSWLHGSFRIACRPGVGQTKGEILLIGPIPGVAPAGAAHRAVHPRSARTALEASGRPAAEADARPASSPRARCLRS